MEQLPSRCMAQDSWLNTPSKLESQKWLSNWWKFDGQEEIWSGSSSPGEKGRWCILPNHKTKLSWAGTSTISISADPVLDSHCTSQHHSLRHEGSICWHCDHEGWTWTARTSTNHTTLCTVSNTDNFCLPHHWSTHQSCWVLLGKFKYRSKAMAGRHLPILEGHLDEFVERNPWRDRDSAITNPLHYASLWYPTSKSPTPQSYKMAHLTLAFPKKKCLSLSFIDKTSWLV